MTPGDPTKEAIKSNEVEKSSTMASTQDRRNDRNKDCSEDKMLTDCDAGTLAAPKNCLFGSRQLPLKRA